MKWSAPLIGRALHRDFLNRKGLVVVPNCYWTGYEADLLVVHDNLRLIDVEIKVSRADLRADAKKDKWWHHPIGAWGQPRPTSVALPWPPKIWRHYYCMPAEIWENKLFDTIPPNSGVVLLTQTKHGTVSADCRRRAKPNPDAQPINASAAVDLARLASLRMWESMLELARLTGNEVEHAEEN